MSSSEAAEEMMRTHDVNFAQRPFLYAASMYYGVDIAFSPYGDYWRQLRRICAQELLSPKCVQSFRSIREEELSKLIADLYSNAGSSINLNKNIFSLTYGITGRAAFGKKCKDQDAFISCVNEI